MPRADIRQATAVVAPALDLTTWEAPTGTGAAAPAAPMPDAEPAPRTEPAPTADPLATESVAQEVARIVRGHPVERRPEDEIVSGFLDDLAGRSAGAVIDGTLTSEASGGPASIFVPTVTGDDWTTYVQPPADGLATLLLNGRSFGGTGTTVDIGEPFLEMQKVVQALGKGDSVMVMAWYFDADTPLLGGVYKKAGTWGELLAAKATEGVKVRLLMSDFDPISGYDVGLTRQVTTLEGLVGTMPKAARDNLKWVASLHPAQVGAIKAALAGHTGAVNVASHHTKAMVCVHGGETIAFCGSVDIDSPRTPAAWPTFAPWHEVHLRIEGPPARDVHKEFVVRWNREKDSSTKPAHPDWKAYETLTVPAAATGTDVDAKPDRRKHRMQMVRTASTIARLSPYETKRDDIRRVYHSIVDNARTHLYFENQYFRSKALADKLVAAAAAQPKLTAIFVVISSPTMGDTPSVVTSHGMALQTEFFTRVMAAFGTRARAFTMNSSIVHAKVLMADDRWACIGTANANDRSFLLDSELAFAFDDTAWVTAARNRLWTHNLGTPTTGWAPADYLSKWDAIASANRTLITTFRADDAEGEAIVPFDWTALPGKKMPMLPDEFARLDFDAHPAERPAALA